MGCLDRLGLDEKTMVVFCSDNGPVMDDGYKDDALEKLGKHRAAGPYTGGKYSVYEGGTRTPFITRWRGTIKPSVSDEMVCTIDLPHSLGRLAGQPLSGPVCLDSFDVLDALLGKADARGRDHLVTQDNGSRGTFGLRSGKWKLHRYDKKTARNVTVEQKLANTKVSRYQLFDLESDPQETKDLFAENPDVAEGLVKKLSQVIEVGHSRLNH